MYSVHPVTIGLYFYKLTHPSQSDYRTFIWYCIHRLPTCALLDPETLEPWDLPHHGIKAGGVPPDILACALIGYTLIGLLIYDIPGL